jgi:L-lactate utilization protein LutC
MNTSQYLQENIGEMLSRGVVKCIELQPSDPVEYLGLWLLHQIELQRAQKTQEKKRVQIEEEKKFYELVRDRTREQASKKIQEAFREYLKKKEKAEIRRRKKEEEEQVRRKRLEQEKQLNDDEEVEKDPQSDDDM